MTKAKSILGAIVSTVLMLVTLSSCASQTQATQIEEDPYDLAYDTVVLSTMIPEPPDDYASKEYFLDYSHCDDGYVSASTTIEDTKVILRISGGEEDFSYSYLLTPHEITYAPVNMGNGHYEFSIYKNVRGDEYTSVEKHSVDVTLKNSFYPYLIPTVFCDYSDDIRNLAALITKDCSNKGEAIQAIFDWVKENISYDYDKANVIVGTDQYYYPNLTEIVRDRKGICLDYAALFGALTRSIGVPTKVVIGDLEPGDIYHAWNQVFIDGEWKSVSLLLGEDEWSELDATMAASFGDGGYEYSNVDNGGYEHVDKLYY